MYWQSPALLNEKTEELGVSLGGKMVQCPHFHILICWFLICSLMLNSPIISASNRDGWKTLDSKQKLVLGSSEERMDSSKAMYNLVKWSLSQSTNIILKSYCFFSNALFNFTRKREVWKMFCSPSVHTTRGGGGGWFIWAYKVYAY